MVDSSDDETFTQASPDDRYKLSDQEPKESHGATSDTDSIRGSATKSRIDSEKDISSVSDLRPHDIHSLERVKAFMSEEAVALARQVQLFCRENPIKKGAYMELKNDIDDILGSPHGFSSDTDLHETWKKKSSKEKARDFDEVAQSIKDALQSATKSARSPTPAERHQTSSARNSLIDLHTASHDPAHAMRSIASSKSALASLRETGLATPSGTLGEQSLLPHKHKIENGTEKQVAPVQTQSPMHVYPRIPSAQPYSGGLLPLGAFLKRTLVDPVAQALASPPSRFIQQQETTTTTTTHTTRVEFSSGLGELAMSMHAAGPWDGRRRRHGDREEQDALRGEGRGVGPGHNVPQHKSALRVGGKRGFVEEVTDDEDGDTPNEDHDGPRKKQKRGP